MYLQITLAFNGNSWEEYFSYFYNGEIEYVYAGGVTKQFLSILSILGMYFSLQYIFMSS